MHLRIILPLLAITSIGSVIGQQLYSAPLEVENAKGCELITLSGGDLLMTSNKDGNLHLTRWNTSGDTIWTRDHQLAFSTVSMRNTMFELSTGQIIVSSYPVALLNENGDILGTLDIPNGDIIELGPDSILGIGYDNMELRNLAGDLLWDSPIVMDTDLQSTIHQLGGKVSNGFVVYSVFMGDDSGFSYSYIYLGRYGNDGSFMDTTLVRQTMSMTAGAYASTNTSDGGILFLGQEGSGNAFVVRTNNVGDTLWTRGYGYGFGPPGVGRTLYAVAELSDGRIILAGSSHDADPTQSSPVIIELDNMGEILCVEHLGPADIENFYSIRSDLAIGFDGTIHALITDLDAAGPWTTLYGYNDLCFTIAVDDLRSVPGFNAFMSADQLIIDLEHFNSDHSYALYNSFGQLIMNDVINSARTIISTDRFDPGIYVIDMTHIPTGRHQAVKLLIH
jgi:hypothetical protein